MFSLRDKLFLASFIIGFALAPCFAQWGSMPPPSVGSPQFPGTPPQLGPDARGRETGSITGSVQTSDGKPVANARIQIISLMKGEQLASQYTSDDGTFTLNNLPSGEYELRAESGVVEVSQRLQVNQGESWVSMRMPTSSTPQAGGSGPTVSVQQLRVPDKAAALLAKAHQAMDKNKLDDAGKLVSRALQAYPHFAQALVLRSVLDMQQKRFDQAVADANSAIQTDPNYGTSYLVMGAALNAQGKYQDALRSLRQAQALLPNAWQGYFESSKALLQLGKFEEALHQAQKAGAVSDANSHPELHLLQGYAYIGLRTYGAALNQFRQYLKQAPAGPYADEARSLLDKVRPLAATAVAR